MDILAITIWREARGAGLQAMRGVLSVILNRSQAGGSWPKDPEQVCLQPWQFSCWNSSDPQRQKYPGVGDPQFKEITELIASIPLDNTKGATAYFDSSIPAPDWAKPSNFTCQISNLKFYKL